MVNLQLCTISTKLFHATMGFDFSLTRLCIRKRENSRSCWGPDKRLCRQKSIYRLS